MKRLFGIARELSDLHVRASRLGWTKYTTGYDFGVMEVHREIQERLKDEESWGIIQSLLSEDLSPLDCRRVEIMEKTFRPYHLSQELNRLSLAITEKANELSSVLNTHRCRLEGRELTSPEIAFVLSTEPDRDLRRKAFLARCQVNEPLVDAGFIELLDLRKEFAREYGTADFVEYSLEKQELEPDMFDSWKDELNSVLPVMRRIRSSLGTEIIGDPDIKPWDEAYIAGRIAPELNSSVSMADFHRPISDLFERFGIDIGSMNITYDIFPRKNKSEWGYNFPVEKGVDSRILANVRDRYTEFGVLLHETGHAVHSFVLDPDKVILNMGISGIVSEGIANLFGGFLTHELFYSQFFGDDSSAGAEAGENFRRLRLWRRASKLRTVSRILFDQSLYRTGIESIDDIHHLFWQVRNGILDEPAYADQPVWASTIHYTTHPIYLHNYLLGDLACDMLEEVFQRRENVSDISEKPLEFGRFVLDEVIGVSGRYPFPELYRRISGEELSLGFFINRLRSEVEDLGS
jgi:oligoendopeptidase F